MYERLDQINHRRKYASYLGVATFDKSALPLGGYTHFIVGSGITDEDKSDLLEFPRQESQIKVDSPFPGRWRNRSIE
jgi:hypothetical protein